ncbi:MAG: hypothetical protein ACRD9L_12690, partial [Bryobacteraceae bacterium]
MTRAEAPNPRSEDEPRHEIIACGPGAPTDAAAKRTGTRDAPPEGMSATACGKGAAEAASIVTAVDSTPVTGADTMSSIQARTSERLLVNGMLFHPADG